MNTGISRFVIRFPEKIALLEGLVANTVAWQRPGHGETLGSGALPVEPNPVPNQQFILAVRPPGIRLKPGLQAGWNVSRDRWLSRLQAVRCRNESCWVPNMKWSGPGYAPGPSTVLSSTWLDPISETHPEKLLVCSHANGRTRAAADSPRADGPGPASPPRLSAARDNAPAPSP